MIESIIHASYLAAAVLFIVGIKKLTRPRTAVRGNQLSSLGMFVAVVVTLLNQQILSYEWIIGGMLLGSAIGAIMARTVKMTSMPQMVAVLNGFGGGASLFVALANVWDPSMGLSIVASLSIGTTLLIGAVTLSGSLVAFGKLQGLISGKAIAVPGNTILNGLLLLAGAGLVAMNVVDPQLMWIYALVGVALSLGLLLVLPIGGADMPVVIALLNSYSGLAAATAGFITGNTVLIVSGSLVGASGLILTQIMCKAMNRSLTNVLFGRMGAVSSETVDADEVYEGKIRSTCPDELAMLLETADRVVIVPGYGMAMAQAQHAVRELANTLEANGTDVKYAIHPVAGRMPGHMNVVLAEAEVPYEQLVEMDEINPQFEQTDVVIVVGANDVTNPMAREEKGCPIYGMPILNVDKARTVVVVKRSLKPGFAGLPNPLFAMDNTLMLFGDGKKAITEVTASLVEGGVVKLAA